MPTLRAVVSRIASPRALAALIVACVCLAVVLVVAAAQLRFLALFAVPTAGMFGAAAADLRMTPDQRTDDEARAATLRGRASLADRGALGLVLVALVGTVVAGWRTRRDVRRWHWLSLLGLPALVACFLFELDVGTCRPAILVFPAIEVVLGIGAAFDLSRKRVGASGRVVAWATVLLALAASAFTIYAASGSTGIIGRWLAGDPPC